MISRVRSQAGFPALPGWDAASGLGGGVPRMSTAGWGVDRWFTRWWFQRCLGIFTPIFWGNDPILTSIFFSNGWFNHQL